MSLILFIIVVLVVLALALWAIEKLPLPQPPVKQIVEALVIIVAALVIAQRAGVL